MTRFQQEEISQMTDTNEHTENHAAEVTIVVDGQKHRVRPGPWVVRDLKNAVGVPPAKVLAEITPQGLVDLDDGKTIKIHEGQRFMSHAHSGAAS